MADWEQKLKHYYENNYDYAYSDALLQRLKALESGPQAAPKQRRRYVLPIAAAIALALSLGAVFAYFQTPSKEAETPEPGYTLTAPSAPAEKEPAAPQAPEPAAPVVSEPQAPAGPATAAPPAEPESTADPPQSAPVQRAYAPTPAEPEDPTPIEPEEEPPAPDDPIPPAPDDPEPPPADDPPPIDDPPPADDPEPADDPPQVDDPSPADDPPQDDDPPIPPPEESNFNAVYRMKGGRELLTLTCLSNGASVELDVTGWMEEASQPDPPDDTPPAPAETTLIYSGHSTVVDVIFDSSITYHLIRGEDGTVRVDLDVA